MALAHNTKEYGVNDCGIYKLSTDVAGTAPTYAAKVDVVGVKSVIWTLEMDTKMLRGDNTLLAADSVLKNISGSVKYAKHNFDVWAAITSAVTTDSGTTPTQKSSWTLAQTDSPAFVKVEAQSKQVDYVGGDVHIVLYKCMPGSVAGGFAEEDYQEQSFDFTAVPVIGTPASLPASSWVTLVANETAVSIT